MWLLNARSLKLEFFEGSQIPPYAVLSHRWESEEVTFQDVKHGRGRRKKGWQKIKSFCKTAIADYKYAARATRQTDRVRHEPVYVWIDTCCIDKRNSTELSEAINSMYQWYRNADVCFAFLADVEAGKDFESDFRSSTWFTRCWTLQELLAPRSVRFMDSNWQHLGNRNQLSTIIASVTGIHLSAFRSPLSRFSVAERMSWAAGRQSTRKEDMAYSLLGIFEVNMPLIYGEGESRAFWRLQEEILKSSDDLTIFAWEVPTPLKVRLETTKSMAVSTNPQPIHSPALYARTGILDPFSLRENPDVNIGDYKAAKQLQGTAMSGTGISVSLYLIPHSLDVYFAVVGRLLVDKSFFSYNDSGEGSYTCILVRRFQRDGRYRRCAIDDKALFEAPANWQQYGQVRRIVLESNVLWKTTSLITPKGSSYGMLIETIQLKEASLEDISLYSYVSPGENPRGLVMPVGTYGIAGMIVIAEEKAPAIVIHLGFDFDFNPFCLVSNASELPSDDIWSSTLSFSGLDLHYLDITKNSHMMRLLLRMQAEGKTRYCDWSGDKVDLHVGSWKDQRAVFRINKVGNVRLYRISGPRFGIKVRIDALTLHEEREASSEMGWDFLHEDPTDRLPDPKSRNYSGQVWAKIRNPEVLPGLSARTRLPRANNIDPPYLKTATDQNVQAQTQGSGESSIQNTFGRYEETAYLGNAGQKDSLRLSATNWDSHLPEIDTVSRALIQDFEWLRMTIEEKLRP